MKRSHPVISPWAQQRRRRLGYRPKALIGFSLPQADAPPAAESTTAGTTAAVSMSSFLQTAAAWQQRFGKAQKTAAAHASAREQLEYFLDVVCSGPRPGSPTDALVAFSTWLITRPALSGPRSTWAPCVPDSARQYIASAAVAMRWSYDEASIDGHITSAKRRHLMMHGPKPTPTKADMSAGILRAIVETTALPRVMEWTTSRSGPPPCLGRREQDETMAAIGLVWCYAFGMRLSDLAPPRTNIKDFNPNVRMTADDVDAQGPSARFRTKVLKNDKFASKFRKWSAYISARRGNTLCPITAWEARRFLVAPRANQPLLPSASGDSLSTASLRALAKRGVNLAPPEASSLSCRHGCASALVSAGVSAEIVSQYQRWSVSGSWATYASVGDLLANKLLDILIG